MSGPWEAYATAAPADGPWKAYGPAEPPSDPTGSFGQNVAAGMGKAVYDVGRGAGQMLRQGIEAVTPAKLSIADAVGLPTQADIDEARRLDAPLMETGGGQTGNVLGNVAMFAPTSMIPGANTVTGAGVVGGIMGALQPTSGDESRLKNTLIGGATAAGMQYGGGKVLDAVSKRAAAKGATAVTEGAQNATRDAALKAGSEAGYVVPPATVKPTIANEMVESLGGKIATAQQASLKNQKVTDTLARQYLGMGDDSILSKGSLADMREVAAAPYRRVSEMSQTAKKLLGEWKDANFESKMQWNYFRRSGDPQAYRDAIAAGSAAEKALDGIEKEALIVVKGSAGQRMVDALQNARVRLAKLHTVESSLTSGGHVDARLVAKMGERFPFEGELKTIADFAGNFPKAIQTPEKIGGMSHFLRPGIGAGIGTVIGGPVGAGVGTVAGVAAPWSIRQMMLSGAGQSMLATPRYGAGATGTIADLLANPALRQTLPAAGAAAALNYGAQ